MVRIILLFFLIYPVMISCDKKGNVRQYTEKISSTAVRQSDESGSDTERPKQLTWETPEGWREEKGSGLRLSSFFIKSGGNEALCTIVPLKGDGGGIRANVMRWLSQLDIKMEEDAEVDRFISRQKRLVTSGDLQAVFLDFTPITRAPTDPSMLVSVVELKSKTVFIKMIGRKTFLIESKDKFLTLCRSLKID